MHILICIYYYDQLVGLDASGRSALTLKKENLETFFLDFSKNMGITIWILRNVYTIICVGGCTPGIFTYKDILAPHFLNKIKLNPIVYVFNMLLICC